MRNLNGRSGVTPYALQAMNNRRLLGAPCAEAMAHEYEKGSCARPELYDSELSCVRQTPGTMQRRAMPTDSRHNASHSLNSVNRLIVSDGRKYCEAYRNNSRLLGRHAQRQRLVNPKSESCAHPELHEDI